MENMYSDKYLKKIKKPLRSPFPVILQTFVLEEHSESTWALGGHLRGTQRSHEHSKATPKNAPRTLEHLRHSRTRRIIRYSGT